MTLLLEWPLATVFLYHGLTKNLVSFAKNFNISPLIAGLVIAAEILGGLGYLVGPFSDQEIAGLNLTQWASLAVIPVLIGAIYLVHGKNGFNVMNGGYEYQMVLLAVALYLFFKN